MTQKDREGTNDVRIFLLKFSIRSWLVEQFFSPARGDIIVTIIIPPLAGLGANLYSATAL
jgi:hypothetical protein